MSKKTRKEAREERKCLYSVLGITSTATVSQIKAAYRKLALQCHPDKNPGDEVAAEKFKEVSTAFAILSDPNKRHRYDMGEVDSAEIDSVNLESVGIPTKLMLSLLCKFGVNMPTAVTPKVLSEAQQEKSANRMAILLNHPPICQTTKNQSAEFYVLKVTQEEADCGICVKVTSSSKSRFKLLHFDFTGQLQQQEDCYFVGGVSSRFAQSTEAVMYFTPFGGFAYDRNLASSQSFLRFDDEVPKIFRKLDGFNPSRYSKLTEGEHLFAVFGDNFFTKCKYMIQATTCDASVSAEILAREKLLLSKKEELQNLESEYMEAKERFDKARERVETETAAVTELLQQRDELYEKYRCPLANAAAIGKE